MVLGIPPYRLRRDLLQDEIEAIMDMGVELRTNARLGRDFSLASLRDEGFEAVFLGVGCMRGRDLQIPGVELDGVLRAVDFLLNANLGYRVDLGDDVLVIGGGNVALDAARTALRADRRRARRGAAGRRRRRCKRPVRRRRAPSTSRASPSGWARAGSAWSRSRAAKRCPRTSSRSRKPRSRVSRSLPVVGRIASSEPITSRDWRRWTSRPFSIPDGRFNPQFVEGSESIVGGTR